MNMNLQIELTDSSDSMTSSADTGIVDIAQELLKAAQSNTLQMKLIFETDSEMSGRIGVVFYPSMHPNNNENHSCLAYAMMEPEFNNLNELYLIKAWAEAAIRTYEDSARD